MEVGEPLKQSQGTGEEGRPSGELAELNVIRTETVFSRLPIHQLSKRGKIEIRIVRRERAGGQISLYWKVSPNPAFGEPRQLAYKLDTLVVNRRLDDLGRPLPRIIRVGSLRAIAEQLNLGGDTDLVKKVFRQNALVGITARVTYRTREGKDEAIDATFTRYNVVFRGQELPDRKKAETVYLILNNPFFEVINHSLTRPQDYDYLAELPPVAQRFYELISYKMFAALRNAYPHAKLSYAEFCAAAPQTRYQDYNHFKKQMYKVHRPHVKSGYIAHVKYERTTDPEGQSDWIMCYTPGPKAKTEYRIFSRRKLTDHQAQERVSPGAGEREDGPPTYPGQQKNEVPMPQQKPRGAPDNEALYTVQRFHELARGVVDYAPPPGSREVQQARQLLKTYGVMRVNFILGFAIRAAERTNFHVRAFGAVLQYVSEALAAYERIEKQAREARRAQMERKDRERREEEALTRAESRLQSLAPQERQALYEQVKAGLTGRYPGLMAWKGESIFERIIILKMAEKLDDRGQKVG